MPRHWFIKTSTGSVGPVTSKTLLRLASQGKLKSNTGVSPDGDQWIKAKQIAGIQFPQKNLARLDDRPRLDDRRRDRKSDTRWYVQTKAGNAGPFTLPKLQKLARCGRVRHNVLVSHDGEVWIKAKRVPGLEFENATVEMPTVENPTFNELTFKEPAIKAPTVEEPAIEQPTIKEPTVEEPAETATANDEEVSSSHSLVAASSHWSPLRQAQYLRHFGSFSEIDLADRDDKFPIDVFIHPPNQIRPFTTLVTSGMSDFAMPVPEGSNSPRTELVLYVDEMHPGYIGMLRALAQSPHRKKTWLSYGSTSSNGDPARPIFKGSSLDSYAFMIPNVESDFMIQRSLQIDDAPVQLMWVVPITSAEKREINQSGMRHFCWLLDQNQHALVIDPKRKCYANIPDRFPDSFVQPVGASRTAPL